VSLYLIGDVQGCCSALDQLLERLSFSPSRDELVILGDLVNRGPASAQVLRTLRSLEGAAHCVLGNHDLHVLALQAGVRRPHRLDTAFDVLQAPDGHELLGWLRLQPLALHKADCLMVHAGVLPSWTLNDTLAFAAEVQHVLRGPDWIDFLRHMYGNTPARWQHQLTGHERLRVIVNALTRLRFCTADGDMEFDSKEGAGQAPAGFMPWFDVPGRATRQTVVAFGHWSTLGWLDRPDVISLDTGCVWGGSLTALEWRGPGAARQRTAVPCEAAQQPGLGQH
jgi:bis(5'-nucleosyl)-tetraphosphatase (symmetrical)